MKITEINAITGEFVERDFTADEIEQSKLDQAEQVKTQKIAETKAIAKAALLQRLGITADEAALLLQ
jgi:hypothetical protein